jgi:CheY-like chemotaxis protein
MKNHGETREAGMATILLIDDDELFAYATARLIKEAGHRVVTLTDSLKALNILETVRDIELLVVDVVMPVGQPNGFAMAKMARMCNPALKVVYMSGYEIAAKDLIRGERVLLKPFTQADLIIEIEKRLREPETAYQ